jgi:hypothetical protein
MRKTLFGVKAGILFTIAITVISAGVVLGVTLSAQPWTAAALEQQVGDVFLGSGDYGDALAWYRKGATWNNADALSRLGMMYEKGLGVARDDAEAYKWYRRAISGSWAPAHPEFRERIENSLASLARSMTAEQVTDANARAARWHPRQGSPF